MSRQKRKCSCLNCHDTVAVNQFDRHYARCLVKGGKFIGRKYSVPESLDCQYCNKLCKNENSLRQHEIRCADNPDKIAINPNFNNTGRVGKNQYIKAKELGLPAPIISEESRSKMGASGANRIWDEPEECLRANQ